MSLICDLFMQQYFEDMVVSRSDAKKRRKEGDLLEDSLQGSPKRTKVHAQRKFAQGSSNLSSPALTPVKDKDKLRSNGTVMSPELIYSKRPKTEDFLTFLCFRGTPILPPQLDFFNVATIQDMQDDEQCSSGGDYSGSRLGSMTTPPQKPQKSMGMEQSIIPGMAKKVDKIENEIKRRPTTSVQALRKKYQEQRLNKQRTSTLSKLAQKVKGKNMVRTRSSVLREESRSAELRRFRSKSHLLNKPVARDCGTPKNIKSVKYMSQRRLSVRGQPKLLRDMESPAVRRGGLRSGSHLPPGTDEYLKTERPLNSRFLHKEHYGKSKTKMFVTSSSEFSSDDDQPLVKKTRPIEQMKPSSKQQLARKMVKRIVNNSRKMHSHMITRSQQQLRNDSSYSHRHKDIQKHFQKMQVSLQQDNDHSLPVGKQQTREQQHLQTHRNLQPQREQEQQHPLVQPQSLPSQVVPRFSNRPVRKTKEAAAIYMELLGKKLVSHAGDGDEDSLSIDSFPELPSSKRCEKQRQEFREKCIKDKQNCKVQCFLQSQEFQQVHEMKKDISICKKDVYVKKDVQVKRQLHKKEFLHGKKYLTGNHNNKVKFDRKKVEKGEEGKNKLSRNFNKLQTKIVKRSLRIAKDVSTKKKTNQIQKRNSKLTSPSVAVEKSKPKLEDNSKTKTKEHNKLFTSNTKLKSSVVGHGLRSRKNSGKSLDVGKTEMESLPKGTKSVCPRRSLRSGSRKAMQSPGKSSTGNTENSGIKNQHNSAAGLVPKKTLIKANKVNLDTLEEKFSDSDEEPLGKIALKSNISRKLDMQEEEPDEHSKNRKLFTREAENLSTTSNISKEKCKLATKVTRTAAYVTDETSIILEEENVKTVLKKKSVKYSSVRLSSERKDKRLVKRKILPVAKITKIVKKKEINDKLRKNLSEKNYNSSVKLAKKEDKTNKNNSETLKTRGSEVFLQSKKIQKKLKDKSEKNSTCSRLPQTTFVRRTKFRTSSKKNNSIASVSNNSESEGMSNTHLLEQNSSKKTGSPSSGLNCEEKDLVRKIKHKTLSHQKISSNIHGKSLQTRKCKGSEKKKDSAALVRKKFVDVQSDHRKFSCINYFQKKCIKPLKKEVKSNAQRQTKRNFPKETELELQRRLSMVCLKEEYSESEEKTAKFMEQNADNNLQNMLRDKPSESSLKISKTNTVTDSCVTLLDDQSPNETGSVDSKTSTKVTEQNVGKMQIIGAKCTSPLKEAVSKNACIKNLNFTFQRNVQKTDSFASFSIKSSCSGSSVQSEEKIENKNEEVELRNFIVVNDDNLDKPKIVKEVMNCGKNDMSSDSINMRTERNSSVCLSHKRIVSSDTCAPEKLKFKENQKTAAMLSEIPDSTENTEVPITSEGFEDALSTSNISNEIQKHFLISNIPNSESLEESNLKIKPMTHMHCQNILEPDTPDQSQHLVNTELYHPKQEISTDLESIGSNIPVKMEAVDIDLEKQLSGTAILNSLLPPDLGLCDMKVKEKLNMSAERVEKWLSENCAGNLEHKRECTWFDKNVCNCGYSMIDDDLCLSDYGNDKMTLDCISTDCVGDEGAVKMTAAVCPFANEYVDVQHTETENLPCFVSSYLKETSVTSIPCENHICDEKETSSSTFIEKIPLNTEKIKSPYDKYLDSQELESLCIEGLEKKEEQISDKECTEIPELLPTNAANQVDENRFEISPLPNSNYFLSLSKNNTDDEKVIEKNSVDKVEQKELPVLLENSPCKVQCIEEKGKPSLIISDDTKKVNNVSKSEVRPAVKVGAKLVRGSERIIEKRSIFQQRRSFPHRVKERKGLIPSANAFSPENESSVYAFDTEPDSPPISTPFRRRVRDNHTSSITTSKSEDDLVKLTDDDIYLNSPNFSSVVFVSSEKLPSSSTVNSSHSCDVKNPVVSQDSSPAVCVRSSASIAVQVNLDTETGTETSPPNIPVIETIIPEPVAQRSMECSTQTEVAEEDDGNAGHMFYIPLQQAPTPAQQLIQGVTVKLGTEGPTGPHQRVIMHAKLVTKPPNFNRPVTTPKEELGIGSVLESQPLQCSGILTIDQQTAFIGSSGASTTDTGAYPPVASSQFTVQSQSITSSTENKYGATTESTSNDQKPNTSCNATSSENVDCPLTKSSSQIEDEKKPLDVPLPTPSVGASPSKFSCKGNSREQKSFDAHSPITSEKGYFGNTKRGLLKGKMSRSSDPSYTCFPSNVAKFPSVGSPSQLVEAPVFYPSEKEFQDPLEYIDRIRPIAETFGLCRVVPPQNFRPECKVSDDMRFTAYNQYVHKMFQRWGPNVKEMMAIKKYLLTQSVPFAHPPLIGGMEVDLPRLYQTVQGFGGLKEVIEKKRWQRVADSMKIPKSAQDRVTKLDDIYCKYLLPYDTLSPDERQKLLDEVEEEWKQRQKRPLSQESSTASDSTEMDADITDEECIVKGRNMPLNAFYRIARNTMAMWFRQPEPSASEVEQEFWKRVMSRNSHVCVHSGSIDSSGCGYGFPCSKNSPFAKHPWNLKVLTNNSGSVLRSIGPIMGVTVPTLHVGMLFTTCCWYRDPHGLPWIEYLHTGANKIWYGVPDSYSVVFHSAMGKLIPRYCKNKTIWLPSDTAMVPPSLLVKHGVSLCHTVQEPGQFIIVFPRAFTSSICTGYLVSESVYFAQPQWLSRAEEVFKDIQDSCEPSMFSLERLLFSIASDARSHVDVLKHILPMVLCIKQKELDNRKILSGIGLKLSERLPLPDTNAKRRKIRPAQEEEGDYECEICRANLFVSLVTNSHEEGVYCLPHAIELLTKKRYHLKFCKLMYTYDQAELDEMIQKLQDKIEAKTQKKSSQGKPNAAVQK